MIEESGSNPSDQRPVCPFVKMRCVIAKRRHICFIITDGLCGDKEYLLTGGRSRGNREGQGASSAPEPNMKDVEGNLGMTQRVNQIQNPINNDDPYEGATPILPHETKYPVIFEPLRNIKFSRSTYKITSFLDFSPYISFFERYEKYITYFLEDIQDNEKVEMIKDPTSIFETHIDMLKYFPRRIKKFDL